jgi:transposase
MPRVSRVFPHLSVEEVQQKIKTATNFRRQQKWLIVYNALVDPREAVEIALHTGATKRTVHQVISDYNRQGIEAIETPGKGGRRHGYLSLTEEKKILTQFMDSALTGLITTVTKIKQAYEAKIGRKVHQTTIYRLLERHEWRKVMPRSHHPDADFKEQEKFKQEFPTLVDEALKTRDSNDLRPVLPRLPPWKAEGVRLMAEGLDLPSPFLLVGLMPPASKACWATISGGSESPTN